MFENWFAVLWALTEKTGLAVVAQKVRAYFYSKDVNASVAQLEQSKSDKEDVNALQKISDASYRAPDKPGPTA